MFKHLLQSLKCSLRAGSGTRACGNHSSFMRSVTGSKKMFKSLLQSPKCSFRVNLVVPTFKYQRRYHGVLLFYAIPTLKFCTFEIFSNIFLYQFRGWLNSLVQNEKKNFLLSAILFKTNWLWNHFTELEIITRWNAFFFPFLLVWESRQYVNKNIDCFTSSNFKKQENKKFKFKK